MNIILCGLPLSGKTTVGKRLAEKIKWPFIDTDVLIEQAYGEKTEHLFTCRKIYRNEGEQPFRELERQQIATLKDTVSTVIAVGGGSLNEQENTKILRSIGQLVYLKVAVDVLWERMKKRGIPAYLNSNYPQKSFYELADTRVHQYEKAADFTIDTRFLNEEETVAAILSTRKMPYGK